MSLHYVPMFAAAPPRPRPPAPTGRSTLNDVSDDDSDEEPALEQKRRDSDQTDDPPVPPSSDETHQPETWEEFWHNSCQRNARRAEEAGGDPSSLASAKALPKGRHGLPLSKGVPVTESNEQVIHCFGYEQPTTNQLECAQCLEIFKRRSEKVAFDTFERAFFCSHLCYQGCYHEHKSRHDKSRSAPTELDGREHEFEPAEGNGALWDAKALKRHIFTETCPAAF